MKRSHVTSEKFDNLLFDLKETMSLDNKKSAVDIFYKMEGLVDQVDDKLETLDRYESEITTMIESSRDIREDLEDLIGY